MSFVNLCSIFSPFCCVLRAGFPGRVISRNLCKKALMKERKCTISSSLRMSSEEAVRIQDAATILSPLSFSVSWPEPSFSQAATLGWDVCCFGARADRDVISLFIKQISWIYERQTRQHCWKTLLWCFSLASIFKPLRRFLGFLPSYVHVMLGVTKMLRSFLVCYFTAENTKCHKTRHSCSAERAGSLYLWCISSIRTGLCKILSDMKRIIKILEGVC